MTTQQPDALRLADLLLNLQTHMGPRRPSHPDDAHCWDGYTQSSAELRRLHAENEALRVQQRAASDYEAGWKDGYKHGAWSTQQRAPATQKLKEQICISDTNQSAACAVGNVGTTSDAQTTRPTHDAPARVLEDAARWHWMAEYLVGTRTDLDDALIASATVDELNKLIDADLAAPTAQAAESVKEPKHAG